jgi:transglutaminase-like putative cysteine protease
MRLSDHPGVARQEMNRAKQKMNRLSRYRPAALTPPRIYLGYIPKGYRGTKRTVEHVKALIRAGAKDFYVRQKAIDIILERGVKAKDYLGEIEALFQWVQQNVRYTKDPFRVEVLHSARRMLELGAGDCDDMTILLGALLEAIGHPVRLVVIGPDPRRPRFFTHIYLEARHKGRWIPLDATMPYPLGWRPETPVREVISLEEKAGAVQVDLQKGRGLYRAFSRRRPSRILTIRTGRTMPGIVVELGRLRGLIYRAEKGWPGRPRTYIHVMEDPPRLVSNVEGTQLYIVGGNYRVTPRGIEG